MQEKGKTPAAIACAALLYRKGGDEGIVIGSFGAGQRLGVDILYGTQLQRAGRHLFPFSLFPFPLKNKQRARVSRRTVRLPRGSLT